MRMDYMNKIVKSPGLELLFNGLMALWADSKFYNPRI
jgi:hypothetical protein